MKTNTKRGSTALNVILGLFGAGLLLVIVLGLSFFGMYQGVITSANETDAAWAQVENQYQRRYDLIPNLVNAVKGAAAFEKDTFTQVAQARASVGQVHVDPSKVPDAATLQKFEAAQQGVGNALSRLMVVAEKYPDLKANQNFRDLNAELAGTENRIATERMRFNKSVLALNNKVKVPPSSWMAGMAGVTTRAYFQAKEAAGSAPEVKF